MSRYSERGMSARAFMAGFSSVAPSSPRGYRMPLNETAAEIASDCIMGGRSSGWSGSIEQREAVAAILAPLNIVYVDDMRGEWRVRGAQ